MKRVLILILSLFFLFSGYFIYSTFNIAANDLTQLERENILLHEQAAKLKEEREALESKHHIAMEELQELTGLVNIQDIDDTIVIDMRYATENNFTGEKVYPAAIALLQRETAEKLSSANRELRQHGYRIKVWDAYRPLHVQQIFWDIVQDRRYVAHPDNGSRHNRGAAVDVTLVDESGEELEMPTGFDDFSPRAARDYPHMTPEARRNMDLLTEAMVRNGFTVINSEWWHFDDANWTNYPLFDVRLEPFLP